MAETIVDPLVAPDVDLRGMDFMPLKGDLLFNSETWLRATPEGRCAALRLWWHAFAKELPAGSLPDDDKLLAAYAGYGEVVRAWKKIRAEAMRGWLKCEKDGRLYHRTVAKLVNEAWERRLDYRDEQEARNERQRRWRERLKKLSKALRDKGIPVPRGASMDTLEKLCRDGGVDISKVTGDAHVDVDKDAGEIGKTGTEKRQGQGQGKEVVLDLDSGIAHAPPPEPPIQAVAPSAEPTEAPPDQPDLLDDEHPLDVPAKLDRTLEGAVVRLWNETAKALNAELGHTEWPEVQKLTSTRRKAVSARLKDAGGIEGIRIALDRAKADPWARGETARPAEHAEWRFNFDYFVKEKTFTQIMERPNVDDPSRRQRVQSRTSAHDARRAGILKAGAGR